MLRIIKSLAVVFALSVGGGCSTEPPPPDCMLCLGTGQRRCNSCDITGHLPSGAPCHRCHGSTYVSCECR